jgi:O-acetyl-ADP-ribose deacetylase (regulator of RNase III)
VKKTIGTASLEIIQGDITTLAVDAIVNAANTELQHGGGVAGVISRKGGPTIQAESDAIIAAQGPLETGDAVITSGGKLPAKFVIHTPGPIGGEGDEDNKLRRSIRNCLALADEKGLKSIAFPAISTGIYGFPIERAAKVMLAEASEYLRGPTKLERVIFCLYDAAAFRVFEVARTSVGTGR